MDIEKALEPFKDAMDTGRTLEDECDESINFCIKRLTLCTRIKEDLKNDATYYGIYVVGGNILTTAYPTESEALKAFALLSFKSAYCIKPVQLRCLKPSNLYVLKIKADDT